MINPAKDARGEVKRMTRSLNFIADRVLDLERALKHARTAADAAAQAKSEFLSNMSHEFRTPLNSIIGFATLIKHGRPADPARIQDYAAAIETGGMRLLALLNDMLDLSQLVSGTMILSEEEFDPRDMVECCLTELGEQVGGIALTLSNDLPKNLPGVRGDRRRLRQALAHVLSNAVRFTPPGGRIRVFADTSYGLTLSVQDTGIGMTTDEIEQVLGLFQQVDGSWARRNQGIGIGLPLAKALVELHGGTISITSARGSGTTAAMRIPPTRVVAQPRLFGLADVPATDVPNTSAIASRGSDWAASCSGRL